MRANRFLRGVVSIFFGAMVAGPPAYSKEPETQPIMLGPVFNWVSRDPRTGVVSPEAHGILLFMTFVSGKIFISSMAMGDGHTQTSAIVGVKGGDSCSKVNMLFSKEVPGVEWSKICAKVVSLGGIFDIYVQEMQKMKDNAYGTALHDAFIENKVRFRLRFDGRSCEVAPTSAMTTMRAKESPLQSFEAVSFTRSACRCNINLFAPAKKDENFSPTCELNSSN
jgi:hypothetical protein